MRIRILDCPSSLLGALVPGQVLDVTEPLARALLAAGYAVPDRDVPVETATRGPRERAVTRRRGAMLRALGLAALLAVPHLASAQHDAAQFGEALGATIIRHQPALAGALAVTKVTPAAPTQEQLRPSEALSPTRSGPPVVTAPHRSER